MSEALAKHNHRNMFPPSGLFKFVGTSSPLRSRSCVSLRSYVQPRRLHALTTPHPPSFHQSLKSRPQPHKPFYFSSSRFSSGRARPPPGFGRKPPGRRWAKLATLEHISPNVLFWGIVGTNAFVFSMWQLVVAKAVCPQSLFFENRGTDCVTANG